MKIRGRRLAAIAASCVAGAIAALGIAAYTPPSLQPGVGGFFRTSRIADGSLAPLPAGDSYFEIIDTDWRPIRLRLTITAPAGAPPEGVRSIVSVENGPAREVTAVAGGGTPIEMTIRNASARPGIIAISVHPETVLPARTSIEIVSANLTPTLRPMRTAVTALAGAAIGLLFGMVRSRRFRFALLAMAIGAIGVDLLGYGAVDAFLHTTLVAPLDVIFILIVLTLPGWWGLSCVVSPAVHGLTDELRALLSIPLTMLIVAVLFLALQIAGAPPLGFSLVFFLLYGWLAGGLLFNAARRAEAARFLKGHQAFFWLQVLVPVAAIFYASVGLDWSGQITEWQHLANRHLWTLPVDNEISWLGSFTWREYLKPNALFFFPWRISDRGPLYSVVHSFLSRAIDPGGEYYALYVRVGIIMNGLFASALFVWVRQLSGKTRMAWAVAAVVALNPFMFLNVYYVWPKLAGAYFALCALVVLWGPAAPSVRDYAIGGALFALAALSHTGQLLSVPMFYAITLVRDVRSTRGLLRSLALPAALIAVEIPWTLYKQWYAPEGYALFVLAYLDNKGFDRPLMENVTTFFREHPLNEQISVRLHHFVQVWWGTIDWRVLWAFWTGRLVNGHWLENGVNLSSLEFFEPWYSAGVLVFPWIAVGAAVNAAAALVGRRGRPSGRGSSRFCGLFLRDPTVPSPARPLAWVALFVFVSLTFNTLTRWFYPMTHALPYLETVLMAAVGVYLLRYLGTLYWMLALVAMVARQYAYFTESVRQSSLQLPLLDENGVLFWLTCLCLIVPAFLIREQGAGSRERGPGIRDQGSGIGEQGPGIRDHGPGRAVTSTVPMSRVAPRSSIA